MDGFPEKSGWSQAGESGTIVKPEQTGRVGGVPGKRKHTS